MAIRPAGALYLDGSLREETTREVVSFQKHRISDKTKILLTPVIPKKVLIESLDFPTSTDIRSLTGRVTPYSREAGLSSPHLSPSRTLRFAKPVIEIPEELDFFRHPPIDPEQIIQIDLSHGTSLHILPPHEPAVIYDEDHPQVRAFYDLLLESLVASSIYTEFDKEMLSRSIIPSLLQARDEIILYKSLFPRERADIVVSTGQYLKFTEPSLRFDIDKLSSTPSIVRQNFKDHQEISCKLENGIFKFRFPAYEFKGGVKSAAFMITSTLEEPANFQRSVDISILERVRNLPQMVHAFQTDLEDTSFLIKPPSRNPIKHLFYNGSKLVHAIAEECTSLDQFVAYFFKFSRVPTTDQAIDFCKTLLKVSIDLTEELANFHDAGFIHNDIKPGNVLMQKTAFNSYKPLLWDFGAAIPKNDCLDFPSDWGTHGYFISGIPAGPDKDKFALGMSFWQLHERMQKLISSLKRYKNPKEYLLQTLLNYFIQNYAKYIKKLTSVLTFGPFGLRVDCIEEFNLDAFRAIHSIVGYANNSISLTGLPRSLHSSLDQLYREFAQKIEEIEALDDQSLYFEALIYKFGPRINQIYFLKDINEIISDARRIIATDQLFFNFPKSEELISRLERKLIQVFHANAIHVLIKDGKRVSESSCGCTGFSKSRRKELKAPLEELKAQYISSPKVGRFKGLAIADFEEGLYKALKHSAETPKVFKLPINEEFVILGDIDHFKIVDTRNFDHLPLYLKKPKKKN
jgi:serine/threonine protein kinase